ncbi:MAG: hypothetical protein LBD99_06435, partial [Candidatus Margulisbacteria bacterium]|nr:hypothetical protein [Candidatus Margulisiibacteriota bacterium]
MRMLLYGPAGTGKTTELLNQYIELKKAAPLRRDVYYLVPTSEHADRIMALALARINPLFSANITTLDKFLGGEKSLSDLEQRLILRKICEGLELEYFGEAQKSAVFYAGLAELLGELKRLCLGQSDLCAKLPNSAKARDLQKIFTEYAQYLRANGLQDREDVLAAYAAPPENCFIFIDGFTDYTPLQYAQLKKLCAGGHSVTAALTYTEEQKDFFAGPAAGVLQTFQSWGFALQKCQEYRRSAAADLKNFALHWGQKKEFTCQNIQILSAGNRGQEIELIARRIAAYKKENPRARWSDIAIIFRSIGAYQFLINEIFLKYQIPVEIHEGIEILQNPFCNLLLSLRDARDNEEVLLAVLKSAYSRAPLEKVRELEFRRAENPDIELEISAPELKNHIAQILDCSAKLRAARNFADLQEVWENFYADNNCAAELKKDLDNPALQTTVRHSNRAYKAMLDALTVLQHWQKKLKLKLSAEELWETFVSALTAKTASRGRNGEQVQVYDALSARQKDYSSVFLANLTLNSWPAGAAENFLLREYEKTSLGLARTEDKMRKEDLIFYQAFTRAAERVYLCFARSEAGGKPLLPSPYVSLLKKFFKNIPEETYSRSAVLDGAEPLCREEYAQSAIYRFCNQEHQSLAAARKSAREKDLECVLAILKQKNDPAQLHQFARTAETE